MAAARVKGLGDREEARGAVLKGGGFSKGPLRYHQRAEIVPKDGAS